MFVLNIEDDVFKHHNICKALRDGGFKDLHIECIKYTHRNGHRVFKIPYSLDIDN